jgi:hypothetical protein
MGSFEILEWKYLNKDRQRNKRMFGKTKLENLMIERKHHRQADRHTHTRREKRKRRGENTERNRQRKGRDRKSLKERQMKTDKSRDTGKGKD